MRFTTQQSDFSAAISAVQKALRPGALSAMLDGIFVEVKEGKLRLMCTDMTLQIECFCTADIEEEGGIVLPGRLFGELVRKLPEGEVQLATNESFNANITAERIKTSIQGVASGNYPEMPPQPIATGFKIGSRQLKDMIRQTRFAASTDESRPILMGVLFEAGELLRLVAIDGYRMAIREAQANIEGQGQAVIPSASLNAIASTLIDSDDEVNVSFSGAIATIDAGSTCIKTTLLSGEYMKYESIIPQDRLTRIRVNRRELAQAIERASLMASETRNNLVKFNVAGEQLVISANSELGSVEDILGIQQIGNDLEIAFNAKYMSDVLKALDEEEVYFDFNNNISPCVIRSAAEGKFTYMILPVRLFAN